MQAPQSHCLSDVHLRASQSCRDVEPALQSLLNGHLYAPPTHDTAAHPFGSELGPGAHVNPSGHV